MKTGKQDDGTHVHILGVDKATGTVHLARERDGRFEHGTLYPLDGKAPLPGHGDLVDIETTNGVCGTMRPLVKNGPSKVNSKAYRDGYDAIKWGAN